MAVAAAAAAGAARPEMKQKVRKPMVFLLFWCILGYFCVLNWSSNVTGGMKFYNVDFIIEFTVPKLV